MKVETDLNALRQIAEAATPGTWIATDPMEWDGASQAGVSTSEGMLTWDDHGGDVFKPADAQFIAAFDPPTVLALIDRLQALERGNT